MPPHLSSGLSGNASPNGAVGSVALRGCSLLEHPRVRLPLSAETPTLPAEPACPAEKLASRQGGAASADELARRPDPVGDRALRRDPERPSICGHRHRCPPATYPRARAGSPQTLAHGWLRGASRSWSCSRWGLPSRAGCPTRWWSLTPPFHPYPHSDPARTPDQSRWRSVLCGTVPQVTPGGRYPPPCPMESGPSSMRPPQGDAPRPPGQLIRKREAYARPNRTDRLETSASNNVTVTGWPSGNSDGPDTGASTAGDWMVTNPRR
jgi:hypothetical protein